MNSFNKTLNIIAVFALFMAFSQAMPIVESGIEHQVGSSPVVGGGMNSYIRNIYTYYTWNATYFYCAFRGFLSILLLADKGEGYIRCVNSFHHVFYMV